MEYRIDTVKMSREFPFAVCRGQGFSQAAYAAGDAYFHRHHCLEINCCMGGSGRYEIGDQSYPIAEGDLFIINDLEYHRAINVSGDLQLLVLVFNADLVLSGGEDYNFIRTFYQWKRGFKHRIAAEAQLTAQTIPVLLELEQEWQQQEVGYRMIIKALLLKLLAMVYRGFQRAEGNVQQVRSFQSGYLRLAPAIALLDDHFREPLTLEQLAECVHLNKNYFSTVFTKLMGCCVSKYLLRRRLRNAALLLACTDSSIEAVALDSGFQHISYFSRAFRKQYGISPGRYRQQLRA